MEFSNPPDSEIRSILENPTTVAVVGCSDNPARDSLRIAKLLKRHGFKVIPVNPQLDQDALHEIRRRPARERHREGQNQNVFDAFACQQTAALDLRGEQPLLALRRDDLSGVRIESQNGGCERVLTRGAQNRGQQFAVRDVHAVEIPDSDCRGTELSRLV